MTLVLATAVSVWLLMVVMNAVDFSNFFVEGTIAVIGGAIIGSLFAWWQRRRARKARRA